MQRPHILRACLLYYAASGGDSAALMKGSGVAAESLLALDPIPDTTAAALFDHVARNARPDFGLAWGLDARTEDYGPLGYLIQNSRTIRDVNEAWLRYSRITGHPFTFSRKEWGDRWEFRLVPRYDLSAPARRMLIEMTLAGNSHISRQMTGRSVTILQLDFPFAPPEYRAAYGAIGGARLCFDADSARLVGRREELDWPIQVVDPAFNAVCESYCRQQLHMADESALIDDRVMDALSRADTAATLGDIAKGLDMTERQLQRRLAESGTSFRDLRRRFVLRAARSLLAEGESVKKVAHRVGLANASSLHRLLRERSEA